MKDKTRAPLRAPEAELKALVKRFGTDAPMNNPKQSRIERLQRGDWSFGCAGMHTGPGTPECPAHLHHHHDDFCVYPTVEEVKAAGIDPKEFTTRTRA